MRVCAYMFADCPVTGSDWGLAGKVPQCRDGFCCDVAEHRHHLKSGFPPERQSVQCEKQRGSQCSLGFGSAVCQSKRRKLAMLQVLLC